jgi:hypothetical protein
MKKYRLLGAGCLLTCMGTSHEIRAQATTSTDISVLSKAPQFGMYRSNLPAGYTPPDGVVVLRGSANAWYTLTKLTTEQQLELGSDLQAKVTYYGGCDSYDRIESIVYVVKAPGVKPTIDDLGGSIEMARFMSPFNYYDQLSSIYTYPLMDASMYASNLADTTHDIWVGIAGGSNPTYTPADGYQKCWDANNNPITNIPLQTFPLNVSEAQAPYVGFSFSLDFVWSKPVVAPSSKAAIPAALSAPTPSATQDAATPLFINGKLNVPLQSNGAKTITGTINVIITSHGSRTGGREYGYNTGNTLSINAVRVGNAFSTQVDCTAFATSKINPLNRGLEQGTTSSSIASSIVGALIPPFIPSVSVTIPFSSASNPRNWCPGAPVRAVTTNITAPLVVPDLLPELLGVTQPVQAQIFQNVTLQVGSNDVSLKIGPFTSTSKSPYDGTQGDYYPVSITFIPSN